MNEKWLINDEWEYFINCNNSETNRDIEMRFSPVDYKLNSPFNAYAHYTSIEYSIHSKYLL